MSGARSWQSNWPAVAITAFVLAACSTPTAQPQASGHRHELAVAWAAGATTDGFHFPIACPGPGKLVMLASARFQLSCDASEKIKTTRVELAADEPGSDEPRLAARKRPPLDCYLVVVPDFNTVPGVVTDLRKGIVAKRSGPLDCALIRYD
jgi:hypothetical protein